MFDDCESNDDLYYTARAYDKGEGVAKDKRKALKLYRQAAACGNSKAAAALGYIFENGLDVPEDKTKAIKYYQIAARWNHPVAQCNLGIILNQSQRYEEALYWWRRAAESGYADADVHIGIAYQLGLGVEQDEYKAYECYREAASIENIEGLIRLAVCYRDGIGVEEDIHESCKLFMKAAEQNDARAWHELGSLYERDLLAAEDSFIASLECYEAAANLGSAEDQARCGEIYAMGIRIEKDVAKGSEYLELAARAGVPRAKYILAVLIARGDLDSSQPDRALMLCREAAEEGESGAQYMLGLMLERGDGLKRDPSQAAHWMRLAAENGNRKAQEVLKEWNTR